VRVNGGGFALTRVLLGCLLQVIQVVKKDAWYIANRRIDVPGQSNVDHDQRCLIALTDHSFRLITAQDGMRTRGGTNHNVCLQEMAPTVIEGDCGSTELSGQLKRVFVSAIDHRDGGCPAVDQVTGGEFAHLACAE
jgi:hypothetical protein